MAANAAAMRRMREWSRLSAKAATAFVNEQGIDEMDDFKILTEEQIEKLKNDRNKLESECMDLESQSEKDLWINDLNEFENEYKNFMKSYYQQTGLDAKIYDKRFIPMKKTKRKI